MPGAIHVDTSRVTRMLDRIATQARETRPAVERAADDAMRGISGVPVDTGELAASFSIRVRGDVVQIVNSAPYARFVFGGTVNMEAQPPQLPSDVAQRLAREVASEVLK